MDLMNENRKIAIDQFSFPLSTELAGREVSIVAPKKKYTLRFEDAELVSFSETGTVSCKCTKMADSVFFVVLGREAQVAVLDLKERLATLILPEVGYVHGAVEQEWKALPEERHRETDELVGTGLRWNFGSEVFSKQVYYSVDRCRMTWSPENYRFDNFPARYTRIRDRLYLVDVNARIPAGTYVPRGYDRFICLQDYKKLTFVGAAFSVEDAPPLLLGGYGQPEELDPTLFVDD